MSRYTSSAFWSAALDRAIKQSANTAVALIGADTLDVVSFDWAQLASLAAGSAVLSILISLGSEARSS